jgi:outer membrane protein OmpA-like peptidoglycan-associated protein
MPHIRFNSPRLSLRRVLAQALVASLIPIGTAFAQAPQVRVTRDELSITSSRGANGTLLMVAPRGTVLEVVHTNGDRFQHRDDNVYWVLVPPDTWGTQRLGWIAGDDVELLPSVARATRAPSEDPRIAELQRALQQARDDLAKAKALPLPSAPITATNVGPVAKAAPEFSEVVLHFDFAKSELTAETQAKLRAAAEMLKANAQSMSFALEGHADWVGSEGFNEKLGLARAEAVKRFLAEQQIPAEKLSVVSHGETMPAASNATPDGRAQNRRVVVKVDSGS